MNNLLLLSAIIAANPLDTAPSVTERFTPHSEVLIGVGDDNTASLTMDDDGFAVLKEELRKQQNDLSFGEAMMLAKSTGRRICRMGWDDAWIQYEHSEHWTNFFKEVMTYHHTKLSPPGIWLPDAADMAAGDWVLIEEVI